MRLPSNMPGRVVVMAGDSWAAGEFQPEITASPLDVGVSRQLSDRNYQVRNLAFPGGSNLQSVDRLKHWLDSNQHEQVLCVLFWITEWFREIWHFEPHQIRDFFKNDYEHIRDSWIWHPYYRLSELSQRWNVPIYVLGGASDTIQYKDFEKDFPGVRIACQSVTNLIVNNDHTINHPVYCEFVPGFIEKHDFLNRIKKKISNTDLASLMYDMQQGQQRLELFQRHPEFFYPDGTHPNRKGHKIVVDFLLQNIPELRINHAVA